MRKPYILPLKETKGMHFENKSFFFIINASSNNYQMCEKSDKAVHIQ